jgi:quercetin dioxygenase-like cupin family protein
MHVSHVISHDRYGSILEVLGPTVEFLTPPPEPSDEYCVMRGTIPPGVVVPLHSHPDPESFFVLSGSAQTLLERNNRLEWVDVKAGDFIHIAGGAKHAHRNVSNEPVVELITTTPTLGRFFEELGKPRTAGGPTAEPTSDDFQKFVRISAKYRYWLGSPAENAAVGLAMP